MARDLRDYLSQAPVSSPQFAEGYIFQVVTRKLNESAIIEIGKDGVARTAAMVDPDNRAAEKRLTGDVIHRLAQGENVVVKAQEDRSEEHTSELQSLMRISYAVFCLKKKTTII